MIRFGASAPGKPDCLLLLVPDPLQPRPRYRWHVRSLLLTADHLIESPEGNGDERMYVFVGVPPSLNSATSSDLQNADELAGDLRYVFDRLPVSERFGEHELVVNTGEVLYVMVWCGGPDGEERTYTLAGHATEQDMAR